MNDLNEILAKIEEAGLVGRGGGCFPTHKKWARIKNIQSEKKYLVCNASEGEPGVKKDHHLLKNHCETVFQGMIVAMDFLNTKLGYLNINSNYYEELKSIIDPVVQNHNNSGYSIKIYIEEPSYIGGESGTILNSIEGKRAEPRLKPPSPSVKGLYGFPTLIHNVETLYNVALVHQDKFNHARFCTVGGQVNNPGVYEVADNLTVKQALEQTNNWPEFPFFAHIGGNACGEFITQEQSEAQELCGSGSIEIYNNSTTSHQILGTLFSFYKKESCGKCMPCKYGSYQLVELLKENEPVPWQKIVNIAKTMNQTSFCGLGKAIFKPISTYINNVVKNNPEYKNEVESLNI